MKFAWSITFFKNDNPITLIEDYTIAKITDKEGNVYEGLVTGLDNFELGTFFIKDEDGKSYEICPYLDYGKKQVIDVEVIGVKDNI